MSRLTYLSRAFRRFPPAAASLLSVALVLGVSTTRQATLTPGASTTYHIASSIDGPLLVVDQQGSTSSMVQTMPQHDEILTVEGGRATRVLARGLTTYTCCVGLAPSPRGRYVAFSQTDAYIHGRRIVSDGLWLTTAHGGAPMRLFSTLTAPNQAEGFETAAVSWSPNRYTLAYTVNLYTDGTVAPSLLQGSGLWLTTYDHPARRHLIFPLAPRGVYAPILTTVCGHHLANPTFDAVSWAPDGRSASVSLTCLKPTSSALGIARAILTIDTTARARVVVAGGRDPAYAPTSRVLTYVTGGETAQAATTLWILGASGGHARAVVSTHGDISSPTWSPDGRTIAYLTAARTGDRMATAIQTVDVASGRIQTVLRSDQGDQPLLPSGRHFTRLAWMHAPI